MKVAALLALGLAVALASNVVEGETRRSYFGMVVRHEALPRGATCSAWIAAVTPGGPADLAGLRPDDRIVAWSGRPLEYPDERHLVNALVALPPGKPVELEVERAGATLKLAITPTAATHEQIAATDADLSGPDCGGDHEPSLSPYLQLVRHAERLGREIEVNLQLDDNGKPVFTSLQVDIPPGLGSDSILSPLIGSWLQSLQPGQKIRFAIGTGSQGFGRITLIERPK
jgi:membrane-associated protease RseP (regulator of RpoE activity)